MYVINEKLNDNLTDQDMFCFHGRDHIFEEMEGLKFKIGPKSFYQTNSEQAYNLYSKTRELAGLTGQETVYDLYTDRQFCRPSGPESDRYRICSRSNRRC
jgi:23S rRNA (uracil1939-C5)-methyltransferase